MDVEAQAPAETSRVSCGGRAVILASSIRIRTRSLPGNAWMSFYVAVGADHTKRLLPQAAAFAIPRKRLLKVTSKR